MKKTEMPHCVVRIDMVGMLLGQHAAKLFPRCRRYKSVLADSSLVSGTELFGLMMTIATPTQEITFGNE